jgi:hypothetical protein
MSMPRLTFSLLALTGFVMAVAVACAALLNASKWTTIGGWTVAMCALAFAIVAAVLTRSRHRAFWSGFAICGWDYMAVVCGPFADLRPMLATTESLRLAISKLNGEADAEVMARAEAEQLKRRVAFLNNVRGDSNSTADPVGPIQIEFLDLAYPIVGGTSATASPPRISDVNSFLWTGQAVWTLLLALLGGLVGSSIHRRALHDSEPAKR